MDLSRQTIGQISRETLDIPGPGCFSLPEKVLQFGTGVLLRGLPDYFIDKANKKGLFNGRVVLVKSTSGGDAGAFERQDGLYTHCVQGIVDGKRVEENRINASISRLLSADKDWESILACAHRPEMEVVISNTTEVGIQLTADRIDDSPPASFPGKLISFLHRRYLFFKGDPDRGMVIIPTELIPANGDKLRAVMLELARRNALEERFTDWLEQDNYFCNSLVDRIVPGKLNPDKQQEKEAAFGYRDALMIMSEPYCLWAIESVSRKVIDTLSFSKADPAVVIAPDITAYRELKLRLLNGSHTFSCGLAWLAGFETVKEAMDYPAFSFYVGNLMRREIVPSISGNGLSEENALDFAAKVLDRFRNPFIEHRWLAITLQYCSKMRLRNVPILLRFFERTGTIPSYMSLGFAAHLLFMKATEGTDGQYYGDAGGKRYLVNDEYAAYYATQWQVPSTLTATMLANEKLWGADLSRLPGFVSAVDDQLDLLKKKGAAFALANLQKLKTID